ncbi:flagellar biosynthetic protein FliO [Herminiimonas sp. CN]|uniref:flagellar biosynthetic protein FliO n=1 Tax=Herminiimonas sp. CN TaxID=1349818 RepID=UPI00047342BC|nr:flagellar biosynthetic protein FliO [Herminiimonas sp. CN]
MKVRYLPGLLPAVVALPANAILPTVAPAAPAPMPALGAAALLQAGLGMVAVLALIFLCAWAVRRLGLQRHASGRLVKVVASTMVGQRERVVVVEIGASWLVLGVTPGQIRSLHTMPAEELPADTAPVPGIAAASAFSLKLRESITKLRRSD